MLLEHLALAN